MLYNLQNNLFIQTRPIDELLCNLKSNSSIFHVHQDWILQFQLNKSKIHTPIASVIASVRLPNPKLNALIWLYPRKINVPQKFSSQKNGIIEQRRFSNDKYEPWSTDTHTGHDKDTDTKKPIIIWKNYIIQCNNNIRFPHISPL
jgi:hypothetical protein